MRFPNILVFLILVTLSMVIGDVIKLGGKHGIIASPKFPIPYGDNIDRTWIISVRKGYRVHLYFTIFDLEDSYEEDRGSCVYDYVQISGYKRLCGNVKEFPQDAPRIKHQVFRSRGNSMTVKFVSDYSNEDRPVGFKAHYTEEDADECAELKREVNAGGDDWDQILYCSHYCNNVPASYYCSCRSGYTLHSNKHTCVANCEAKRNILTNGFLQSDHYPQLYAKLSNCETTLQARKGWRIDVRFDRVFGIEEHYEEGCVYDWLRLTDDKNVARTYCGSLAPKNGSWIPLNTNSLRVFFKSDLSTEGSGYKLYYKIYRVKCLKVLRSPSNGEMKKRGNRLWNIKIGSLSNVIVDSGWSDTVRPRAMQQEDGPARLQYAKPCFNPQNYVFPVTTSINAFKLVKHCAKPMDLLSIPRTHAPLFPEKLRPYNSSISITCLSEWYELVSGATEWFCDDDETWHWRGVLVSKNDKNNFPECRPKCGNKNENSTSEVKIEGQIIGGKTAFHGEWPWMAFIDLGGRAGSLKGTNYCGGSLVGDQYIVTATHCFRRVYPHYQDRVRVYLGVTDRFSTPKTKYQVFKVSNITLHPRYLASPSLTTRFNVDIAVLKLEKPAILGPYVRPICIPRTRSESDLPLTSPEKGVVIGWGLTVHRTPARILSRVDVPYVDQEECKNTYNEQSRGRRGFKQIKITKNNFCAGYLERAIDACTGDSGGPLMWRSNKRWFLNGIVSFSTKLGSCDESALGVYTNVTNFHDFLDENIQY